MNYLVIYTEEDPLRDRSGVRVKMFASNPPTGPDLCDAELRPLTEDVERAVGELADTDQMKWEGTRQFVIVPLDAAYTVNVERVASVQVGSTGSLW